MRSHICNQFVTICWASSLLIAQEKQSKPLLNFVTHSTKRFKLLLRRRLCGIIESPMDRLSAWKDGAVLFGAVANGAHVIKLRFYTLIHFLHCLQAHPDGHLL